MGDTARILEAIHALKQHIDARCDAIEARFDARCDMIEARLDGRCDTLETRLGGLDKRADGIEQTLASLVREHSALNQTVGQYGHQVARMEGRVEEQSRLLNSLVPVRLAAVSDTEKRRPTA